MSDAPFDVEIRVGEIVDADPFDEARKPQMMKLWIDTSDEELQSAAQMGYNYDVEEVVGRQVLVATNLGSVQIAGFTSEVLTLGVPDADGNAVFVTPEQDVPLGGVLH